MSLEDFNKIQQEDNIVEEEKNETFIDEIDIENIEYYLSHFDELIENVKESHFNYMNAKLKHEFKHNSFQVSINWNEENALRESNGLPKVTNQNQRDSVIKLKLKHLYDEMKSYEHQYKMYDRIFNFISNNFELLCELYGVDKNAVKNVKK